MKIKHLTMLALVSVLALAGCGQPQEEDTSKAVLDNIFARRSVRAFTEQEVTEAQVETLLKAAMAAPSGMNLQPWRFIVVRNQSLKDKLSKKGSDFIATAPVVIVVCAEMIETEDSKTNQNWTADCAAATENLLLAAQAMGLGACWTACYPYFDRQLVARKALKLPENVSPYCVIPVGYPAGDSEPKNKWNAENIHYERWDNSAPEEIESILPPLPGKINRNASID